MNLKLPYDITVVQDTKEKRPWFDSKEFDAVHIYRSPLTFGDYGRGGIEIERKSENDLARDFLTVEHTRGEKDVHRWHNFLQKTKQANLFLGKKYCILVEGTLRGVIDSQSGPQNRRIKRARIHQLQKYTTVIFAGDRHNAQVIALELLSRPIYDDDNKKTE